MRAGSMDGEFALSPSRKEVIMISEALGWIEAETVSDQALLEFVGGSRHEVRELASQISGAYKAWMTKLHNRP